MWRWRARLHGMWSVDQSGKESMGVYHTKDRYSAGASEACFQVTLASETIQGDLDKFQQWAVGWDLQLNLSKCQRLLEWKANPATWVSLDFRSRWDKPSERGTSGWQWLRISNLACNFRTLLRRHGVSCANLSGLQNLAGLRWWSWGRHINKISPFKVMEMKVGVTRFAPSPWVLGRASITPKSKHCLTQGAPGSGTWTISQFSL